MAGTELAPPSCEFPMLLTVPTAVACDPWTPPVDEPQLQQQQQQQQQPGTPEAAATGATASAAGPPLQAPFVPQVQHAEEAVRWPANAPAAPPPCVATVPDGSESTVPAAALASLAALGSRAPGSTPMSGPGWRCQHGKLVPPPCAPELIPCDDGRLELGRSTLVQWPTVVHASAYTVELFDETTGVLESFRRAVPDNLREFLVELRVSNLQPGSYGACVRCVAACGCESSPSPWSFLPPVWMAPQASAALGWPMPGVPQMPPQPMPPQMPQPIPQQMPLLPPQLPQMPPSPSQPPPQQPQQQQPAYLQMPSGLLPSQSGSFGNVPPPPLTEPPEMEAPMDMPLESPPAAPPTSAPLTPVAPTVPPAPPTEAAALPPTAVPANTGTDGVEALVLD